MRRSIALVISIALASNATADDEYRRVTLSVNAPYLLVPVFILSGEFAVAEKWSGAVRGGLGRSEVLGIESQIVEAGAQASYYMLGNASRGMQIGLDARVVSYEGDGKLMGLGDGLSIGPFVGYKRTFAPGFTLGAQLGVEAVVVGESDDRVLPYLALSAGWSFWAVNEPPAVAAAPSPAIDTRNPLDHHDGLLLGFGIGGGSAFIEGCRGSCELEPGIAVDASIGWFLHRRFALVIDSTALTAFFSLSSGFGAFAFGLTGVGLQAWPHEDLWVKLGVGATQLTSSSFVNGFGVETGGGGTLAVGYEFHHGGRFNMDLQLRAVHGSFHPEGGELEGVNTFVGLVGFRWY